MKNFRFILAGATMVAITPLIFSACRSLLHPGLPSPGPQKQDPERLDEILDNALEDSMIASDPQSTIQPDVKRVAV